jgi:hypothetical protein
MTTQISIYNHATGVNTVRDMTEEELSDYQIALTESKKTEKLFADIADARQAVLNKLGLTAEEAQLLLGGV